MRSVLSICSLTLTNIFHSSFLPLILDRMYSYSFLLQNRFSFWVNQGVAECPFRCLWGTLSATNLFIASLKHGQFSTTLFSSDVSVKKLSFMPAVFYFNSSLSIFRQSGTLRVGFEEILTLLDISAKMMQ